MVIHVASLLYGTYPDVLISMVISYHLSEKSERGASVGLLSRYYLFTSGKSVTNSTDIVELKAVGTEPVSWASFNSGVELLMAVVTFDYYFHLRRKVSGCKRVGKQVS